LNAQLDTILEIASSNVYQGIEVNDTSEMQRKSEIVKDITKLIQAKQLSHEDAAKLLKIELAQLVGIKRGQFREIEEDVLLAMASKLSA
jgi:predicted XRE-type DNA-binding protein